MKTNLLALFGLCAAVTTLGCNNGGAAASLNRITQVSSDAKCPNGGVIIATGPDTNGNGSLDTTEVAQSSELCNGVNGSSGGDGGANGTNGSNGLSSLVKTTMLAVGSAQCPNGGVQVDLGVDDGANGATANNGMLEAGEVRTTNVICNGTNAYYPGSTAIPGGPEGTGRIQAIGGIGAAVAGSGGAINVRHLAGTLGGGVKVFKTGTFDAGFALPTLTFVQGAVPATVTASTTIRTFATTADGLASGDAVFQTTSTGAAMLVKGTDGGAETATSLDIAAGITVTIAGTGSSVAGVSVSNDLRNAGTLTAGPIGRGPNVSGLQLSALNFISTAGSAITLDGVSTASQIGGSPGAVTILGINQVVNQGRISTVGGNGSFQGANGGSITMSTSLGDLYNTGALDSHGGNGPGIAGLGGSITFTSRSISNSGNINAVAGAGSTSLDGASVSMRTANGPLINTGAINAAGGSCAATRCAGGPGGTVSLRSGGNVLWSAGKTDVSGGQGSGSGGIGGTILFESIASGRLSNPAPGSIRVSGDLLSNGGGGNAAGNGGTIDLRIDTQTFAHGQEIELFGYSELNVSGGACTGGTGGSAGTIAITTASTLLANAVVQPSGPVINSSTLIARGGTGLSAGFGGNVALRTAAVAFSQPNERLLNTGSIDVSAGQPTTGGSATPGNLVLQGLERCDNRGALTSNGSNGGGQGGGNAGLITIFSATGLATNSGAIEAKGGLDSSRGGNGGVLQIDGADSSSSGTVNLGGGNSTAQGGNGGLVLLMAFTGHAATTTSTINIQGGTGTTVGKPGRIIAGGVEIFP